MKWSFIKFIRYKYLKRTIISSSRIINFNKDPILIGGCGRTGTTLITAILDAHPEIFSHPFETSIFKRNRKYKNSILNYYRNLFWFYLLLLRHDIPRNTRRWCEKTPGNLHKISEILQEFGSRVRFILMIRDGRDVVTSMHPNTSEYYISDERWINDTALTLEYQDHNQVLIVPYESLVQNFDKTIRKILEFLGCEYYDQIHNFVNHSKIQSHDAFHKKKLVAIHKKSIDKCKRPEHAIRINELISNPKAKKLLKKVADYKYYFDNKP